MTITNNVVCIINIDILFWEEYWCFVERVGVFYWVLIFKYYFVNLFLRTLSKKTK